MKSNCKIIEDLLPLYIDDVCSEESKMFVEEHLKECESCSLRYKAQKNQLIVSDDVIKENLKSKKPFKKIRRYQMITVFALLLVMVGTQNFMNCGLILNYNPKRFIEKREGMEMTVKCDKEYSYKGKTYRIILTSPKDTKDRLYMQCFEESFGGLLYKPTYGTGQGGSSFRYGFTQHFINDNVADSFFIVYGYNRDLKASTFSVRKQISNELLDQTISGEEYFLYIYTGIVYPEVTFKDKQGKDITYEFQY